MSDWTEIREPLTRALARHPEIRLAIVYGSFAAGKAGPRSDLDLALAREGVMTAAEKVEIINHVASELGREVDLIDLNAASGTVAKEAIGRGKIVLNKDPSLLARVLSRLIYEEEDFQKMRARLMAERRTKAFHVP